MGKEFPAKVKLTAEDKASGPIKRLAALMEAKLDKRFHGVAKLAGRATKATAKMAANIAKIGSAGLVAGLGVSIKKFGDLDDSIGRIQTLLPPGVDAMERFGQTIQANAVRFGRSQQEVADAVFQAISGGIKGTKEEVESFQEVVGKASVGGFAKMEDVTNTLLTAMDNYGIATKDAITVSDKLFATNRLGRTTIDELSKSLGRVLPTSAAVGVSLEEMLAVVATTTKSGAQTNEVMSAMKAVFGNLKEPSEKAKKAASDLKTEFSLTALRTKGLAGFMNDLVIAAEGDQTAIENLFGSMEAFNAIAKLTSTKGLNDFNTILEEIKLSSGETEKAAADTMSRVGFKTKQLGSLVDAFFSSTGGGFFEGLGFNPKANPAELTKRVMTAARELGKTLGSVAGAIGNFLASIDWDAVAEGFRRAWRIIKGLFAGLKVFIKVSMAAIVASITLALGPVLAPWIALGAAITAIVAALTGNWEEFAQFFEDLWEGIAKFLDGVVEDIKVVLDGMGAALDNLQDSLSFVTGGLIDTVAEDKQQELEEIGPVDVAAATASVGQAVTAGGQVGESLAGLGDLFTGFLPGESTMAADVTVRLENAPPGTKVQTVKSDSPKLNVSTQVGRRNMAAAP